MLVHQHWVNVSCLLRGIHALFECLSNVKQRQTSTVPMYLPNAWLILVKREEDNGIIPSLAVVIATRLNALAV